MNIISAHQQGLLEQLDEEVGDLAGAARDFGQRAVVLHHLYDHSRGANGWALAEARRNLFVASRIAQFERRAGRWAWTRRDRSGALEAIATLKTALGEEARERAARAYRAWRLSATAALRDAARDELPGALFDRLIDCHSARRSGASLSEADRQALAAEYESFTGGGELDQAWSLVDKAGLGRTARRYLGEAVLQRQAQRDRRRGDRKVEQLLLADPALPRAFRANPAQHFYAMVNSLAERRRRDWRKACDVTPDAVAIAA
jgi:hypothetical protein